MITTVAREGMAISTGPKRRRLTEPVLVRWTLIGVALGFLTLFLAIPLTAVFVEALANGLGPYLGAIVEPDAMAALDAPSPTSVRA
jgi:sulfate transport system permease protein